MRALIDELVANLRAFISQDEEVLLSVAVNDASNGITLKAIDAIDQTDDGALVWSFADDFRTAHEFADSVIDRLSERRSLACGVLEQMGKPPWPPLPPEALDRERGAVERMRSAMTYARDLSPDLDAMHLVWAMFPSWIADGRAYRAFIADLMAHDFPTNLWCHHMRVLVRDDVEHPVLHDIGQSLHGARSYTPRLSADDIRQSIEEQASDENRSPDERFQAVVILAGLDYAHRRFEGAYKKYALAREYYAGTQQDTMNAITLNGMGEVLARVGSSEAAREHFEAALTPVFERFSHEEEPGRADALPVILNISLNLGNLHLLHRRWGEAKTYYEGAAGIADALRNAQVKIMCLENIGACLHELEEHEAAIAAWEDGCTLARALGDDVYLQNLLRRMRAAFDKLGLRERRDKAHMELRLLQKGVATYERF